VYTRTADWTRWIPILKLLIQHGADVHAYTERRPRRKSALLVLQECTAGTDSVDMKSALLEVMQILEKKGAKAELYWAPLSSENLEKLSLGEAKSAKAPPVKKENTPRRVRRYLNRLFGRPE
jgi:hypothetical protein